MADTHTSSEWIDMGLLLAPRGRGEAWARSGAELREAFKMASGLPETGADAGGGGVAEVLGGGKESVP